MNLYDISTAITELVENPDPITGEIDMEALDKLELVKDEKQLDIIKLILHMDNDMEIIAREQERLKALKAMALRRKESMEKYLMKSMKIDHQKMLDYPAHKVIIKQNPPKLMIEPGAKIPDEFLDTKMELVPNKIEIKKAIQGGQEIKGCSIVQEERLDIK